MSYVSVLGIFFHPYMPNSNTLVSGIDTCSLACEAVTVFYENSDFLAHLHTLTFYGLKIIESYGLLMYLESSNST